MMRYLDQERDGGEDVVVFHPDCSFVVGEASSGGISLRDHALAVVGLQLEADRGELKFCRIRVIRGCTRILEVNASELPTLSGEKGPYECDLPSPWPTYIYNPPRQSLDFVAVHVHTTQSFALRFWWKRLEGIRGGQA